MKELSIEEKAKAYDDAKLRMSAAYNSNRCTIGFMNEIFPELKESEDERIRKFIKDVLDSYGRSIKCPTKDILLYERAIAWLEKQGNLMKALQISNARIGELIEKNYYLKEQLEKQVENNMGISEATKQELEDNLNKALEKETPESCNEFLDEQGEQKTTIEMITPEESLGIDSDTYNKIVDECVYGEQKPIKEHNACEFCEDRYGCVSPCSMKLIEDQKPAWSGEDDKKAERIIRLLQEAYDINCINGSIDWLKSLKERYTWKPSGEQMLAINTAINVLGKGTINGKYLIELQEQLKKLK